MTGGSAWTTEAGKADAATAATGADAVNRVGPQRPDDDTVRGAHPAAADPCMVRPETPTPAPAGHPSTIPEWVALIDYLRATEPTFESPPLFPPMDALTLPLPATNCAHCAGPLTERQISANRSRRQQRRFCSLLCYGLAKRGVTFIVICPCGMSVDLPTWRRRQGLRNRIPQFCSRACYERLGRGRRRSACQS